MQRAMPKTINDCYLVLALPTRSTRERLVFGPQRPEKPHILDASQAIDHGFGVLDTQGHSYRQ